MSPEPRLDPVRAGELLVLGAPVLEPPPMSSDDGPPSTPEGVFGRTLAVAPERVRAEQREAGVGQRAYLRETEPGRWSGSLAGPARAQHLITRDAYLLGAGADVDLRLQGTLMPRVVAVIVRGVSGFSVLQVAGWPWQTKVNGRVVVDQERLEDGDVLTVAGRCFTFHHGLPGAAP